MGSESEIITFEDAHELWMVELDKSIVKIISICNDWQQVNIDSSDMNSAMNEFNSVLREIFRVKAVKFSTHMRHKRYSDS